MRRPHAASDGGGGGCFFSVICNYCQGPRECMESSSALEFTIARGATKLPVSLFARSQLCCRRLFFIALRFVRSIMRINKVADLLANAPSFGRYMRLLISIIVVLNSLCRSYSALFFSIINCVYFRMNVIECFIAMLHLDKRLYFLQIN